MGLKFRFSLLPDLHPDEKIEAAKKWVGFCTGLSFPNYRWSFSLPPLIEQGVLITDKRILHVFYICRIFSQQFDQWFDSNNPAQDAELIQEVTSGRHWLLGSFLEIISENQEKPWYRSRKARIRIYTKDADQFCKIITESMIDRSAETLRG